MSHTKLILLVDCNNFFVSCERLFRPDLAKKPVLVLSSNDGCVISRSAEVKALGVPMGIPHFQIKKVIEDEGITIFSSNFTLYRDISHRVMEVLRTFHVEVEQYSIDEAFMTVPADKALTIATEVRNRVIEWVGIPVSVGVAPTRVLAKCAGDRAKKGSGVSTLTDPKHDQELLQSSVRELWGIGRQSGDALERAGILTVHDMHTRGASVLRAVLGKNGERIFFEVSGIQAPHETARAGSSMTSTRSFGTPTRSLSVVEGAVTHHVSELAERLRREGCEASLVVLEVATQEPGERKEYHRVQAPLLHPTDNTAVLLKTALELLRHTFSDSFRYVKAGVTYTGITHRSMRQASLLETVSDDNSAALMKALDSVTERFGPSSLYFGTMQKKGVWSSRSMHISPRYTTSWNDLKNIRTE